MIQSRYSPAEHRSLLLQHLLADHPSPVQFPLTFALTYIFPDISLRIWEIQHDVVSHTFELTFERSTPKKYIEFAFLNNDEL